MRDGDLIAVTDIKAFIARMRTEDSTIEEPSAKFIAADVLKYRGAREFVRGGATLQITDVEALKENMAKTGDYIATASL